MAAASPASAAEAPEPAVPEPAETPAPVAAIEAAASVAAFPVPTPAAPVEPAAAPAVPTREYKDGSYLGWGYSRHGNIQAEVVVQDGQIVSAEIAQCRTRYSCSWVEHLPGQIVSRQRAAVDFVSGATQSSYAFEDAVAEALAKAK